MVKVLVTLGDPAGIGPEIAIKALAQLVCQEEKAEKQENAKLALAQKIYRLIKRGELALSWLGSRTVWEQVLKSIPQGALGCAFTFSEEKAKSKTALEVTSSNQAGIGLTVNFYNDEKPGLAKIKPGHPSYLSGEHALHLLKRGCTLLSEHEEEALVTCPLSKEVVAQALPGFVGHTEYLEAYFNAIDTTVLENILENTLENAAKKSNATGKPSPPSPQVDPAQQNGLSYLSFLSYMAASDVAHLDVRRAAGLVSNGDRSKNAATKNAAIMTSGASDHLNAMDLVTRNLGARDFQPYKVSMGFVSPAFNLVLMTRHLALREVAKALTFETIVRSLRHANLLALLTEESMASSTTARTSSMASSISASIPDFSHNSQPSTPSGVNASSPPVATSIPPLAVGVLALNPHGGEGGLLGTEEPLIRKAIAYVTEEMRYRAIQKRMVWEGPLSADTAFMKVGSGRRYQNIVACYHDQGLIPLKTLAGMQAVNVTLGLPFIRTSVDHGTAFDIAGKNVADETSLLHAIYEAWRLQRNYRGLLASFNRPNHAKISVPS